MRHRQPTHIGAGGLARGRPCRARRLQRRTLASVAGLLALLVFAVLLVAYAWQPPEDRGYRSPYLAQAGSRYVDTPVARFHYIRTGHGPPVVLLPGGTLWTYSYRAVIPQLAKHFTVVAVDMPGQGYTTVKREDFRYDLEAMSGGLESFMDAVGLPRASLVGHSWDGAIALYFAERHPQRVHQLVLIDSPGVDDASSWDFRPLEFPVVGEVIGKLMSRSTFRDPAQGIRSPGAPHPRSGRRVLGAAEPAPEPPGDVDFAARPGLLAHRPAPWRRARPHPGAVGRP